MKNHQRCHSPTGSRATIKSALGRLKEAGFKLTKPREALLKSAAAFARPFSAEDLHRELNDEHASGSCDLVTVYRSLATFNDLNILDRVDFGDGVVRYEFRQPGGSHHHHFICKQCHKIEPLHVCEVESLESALAKKGYRELSHRLELFGLCPECG